MTIDKSTNAAGLPRLPVNLRDHKFPIGINWGVIILSSGILPIVGYFALRDGTNVALNIVLAPWLGFMGATSIFALLKRSWYLLRKNSDCRPLGVEEGWKMDYFGWNFLGGFIALSVLISLGIAFESVLLVSLPLSVLILYVCIELLLAQAGMAAGMRAPFRFSSLAKGEPQRPGTFIIVEDVVAVDGKQGRTWRSAWSARYEASSALRSHLRRMDMLWGTTGLAVVAVIWGCAFGIDNHDIGYAIGWALPWVWAGLMTLLTIQMSKAMLRKEEVQRSGVSA
jgi:hypothetical protein